uniref:Uncharacterized protein n=1 Tax=Cavia porcellus TaxID=10141 RepID=A0A286XEQ6_CAVPO
MFSAAAGQAAPKGPCAPDVGVTTEGPCPAGYFCPVGTGMPLPCPVGTFSDRMLLSMASECLPCPPGHFCAASGLTSPSGLCAPGYFCLVGVTSPTPTGLLEDGGLCPQGHFCPWGTSLPLPCPAGSYNSLLGQASCFSCPAGYYCPENITDYREYPCPPGFYCPQGTKYATQFPCPRGYYNPDSLTHSLDSCLPCPPGHYCSQENLTQASGPCDAGWFCVLAAWTSRPFDLDNYTSTNCLCPATATGGKCPAGSYCPKGSPEPTPCPPGSFCATPGLSTPSGPCQAGYFCAGGSASPAPEDEVTGAPCPPGFFCTAGSHRPMPCPAGTFSSLPKQTLSSACQDCPPGFFCKEAGLQSPSGQCPAGYYCDPSAGPIQDFSLYPCPQGYYCPLGTAKAIHHSCPVGTFGARKGLMNISECQPCPAGKFCAQPGLTDPTGDCASGHWCKSGATSKDPTDGTQGFLCPPGHYCLKGAAVPAPCPPGTWSGEGTKAPEGCQQCFEGQLCPGRHSSAWPAPCHSGITCTGGTLLATPLEHLFGRTCPPGHFCLWGTADPTPCPSGSYISSTHTEECLICPQGHYCVPGMRPQLCPRGFYCPKGTGMDWQPCPPGTYGPEPGLSTLQGCHICGGGMFCPETNATEAAGQCWEGFFCTRGSTRPNPEPSTEEEAGPCPRGHYCPRGSAVPQPCPPGTFNPWIKLGSEASCSPCLPGHYCGSSGLIHPSGPCSEGFFCLRGAITPNRSLEDRTGGPCPAGHFCPLGAISPKPCPAGTHTTRVAQGGCEPCPQGFFCPANTSSTVGNECPAGHFCPASTAFASQFPCPRGTYNPQRGAIQQSDCMPCEPGKGLSLTLDPIVSCLGWWLLQGPAVLGSTALMEPLPRILQTGSQETSALRATSATQAAPCQLHVPLVGHTPTGFFLPIPGAMLVEDCQPCPAGWFCSRAGLSSPEALCEGGWYCPQASVSGHSPDTICPPGHWCPSGSPEPRPCPPGQYQDAHGQSFCKSCPAGKFCPGGTKGQGARSVKPMDCPAGYYCPPGTQSPTQHPCPTGTFRERPGALSAKDCRPCLAGQFCADSGIGKRFPDGPCSAGYYCPPGQTSATPKSFRCPSGFYCPEGSPQPRHCEKGTFQPQEAQSSCELCPAGFYCEASSTDLVSRRSGYFCPPGSHSATAHPCPRGTFGPKRGATVELDCEPCPAGMFCSSEGLPQPSGLCHSGHYCTGGAMSPTPIKHQVEAPGFSGNDICPPGFFCPTGTRFPLPCPPGFYSSVPGLDSKDQCQPCPVGHYCSQPGLSSILGASLCHAGYICLQGSTVPSPFDGTNGYRCPPGFRCPPGANHELPCKPGTFSLLPGSASCLACPQGTYCPQAATVKPTICPKGNPGARHPFCSRSGWRYPVPSWVPGDTVWMAVVGGAVTGPGQSTVTPALPIGHYCPAGTSSPCPCPEGTMSPKEGAVSPRTCLHCPAGSYCPGEGNEKPEDSTRSATSPTPLENGAFHLNGPCPRGHYCPQGTLYPVPCPLGTTRNRPGEHLSCAKLSLLKHCYQATKQKCPRYGGVRFSPQGRAPTSGVVIQGDLPYTGGTSEKSCGPCPAGFFCPSLGFITVGHFCQPGAAWPAPCHRGHYQHSSGSDICFLCPAGSYCPHPGSVVPRPCPAYTYCPAGQSLCPPGTFTPQNVSGLQKKSDCSICPPGHYCRSVTTCCSAQAGLETIGLNNRALQMGCVFLSMAPKEGHSYLTPPSFLPSDPPSKHPCHSLTAQLVSPPPPPGNLVLTRPPGKQSQGFLLTPQVSQRCPPGDIRLAATHKCVSPQMHDCTSFCHPGGGELSVDLGICQCWEYVSSEELCDIQCLTRAPQLSLSWGHGKELILSMKREAGDIIQKEVSSTLGPDQPFPGSARAHLVHFGPHGTFGFIISKMDVLGSFLQTASSHQPRKLDGTSDPEWLHAGPRIPNPVVCVAAGDVILFQLHLLPHNRSASHYPVYQRQHLLNSNPHWDFGAFRRLHYLVQETHFNLSRFAHQFLDPGTYVFQDNGKPEDIAVVRVQEEGTGCGPGLSPVQPSSPYQLGRLGILQRELLLGPDWAAITGVLLVAGLVTTVLTGLGLLLRPRLPQACPMQAWRPHWRSLGFPHVPTEHTLLRDSFLFYKDFGGRSSGAGTDPRKKTMTGGTGEPPQPPTLEDFSVRTLYDKLEDQNLHVAAQLSRHQRDVLAFYRTAGQQLQGLQDFLQGLSMTDLSAPSRDEQRKMGAGGTVETEAVQSGPVFSSHTAASPREHSLWLHQGCTPRVPSWGFQLELDRAIASLASVLSQGPGSLAGASRKVSGHRESERTHSPSSRLQQDPRPLWLPQSNAKRSAQSPGPGTWILKAGCRQGAEDELQ